MGACGWCEGWCINMHMLSFILIIFDWFSDLVVYLANKEALLSYQYTNTVSLWLYIVCGTFLLIPVCGLLIYCCCVVKAERFVCMCCVEVLAVMFTLIHNYPLLGASLYIMHCTNLTTVCGDKKDFGQEEERVVPHTNVSTGTLLFSSATSFVAISFRSIKSCIWCRNEDSCAEAASHCFCVHAVAFLLSCLTLISALWFYFHECK